MPPHLARKIEYEKARGFVRPGSALDALVSISSTSLLHHPQRRNKRLLRNAHVPPGLRRAGSHAGVPASSEVTLRPSATPR